MKFSLSVADNERFDDVVKQAAFDALQSMTDSSRLINGGTKLVDLEVDSLSSAAICASIHSRLKQVGIEVPQEIVDNAVLNALTDANASVSAVVSAVRTNMRSEISLASSNPKTKLTA